MHNVKIETVYLLILSSLLPFLKSTSKTRLDVTTTVIIELVIPQEGSFTYKNIFLKAI